MEFPTIWITALTVILAGFGFYFWLCCQRLKSKMAEVVEWMECMVDKDCSQAGANGIGWIERRLQACGCGTNGGDPPPKVPSWP